MQTVLKIAIIFLAFQTLLSCESNFREVQKINYAAFVPSGEAENFNLKYTDSGKIKSILVSPRMMDFSNVSYPYTEFPVGINVTMYDEKAAKTYVKSDYAITYKGSDLIDLRGNVKIWNDNGQALESPQLYFDQKNEWFYTEKNFKFTDPKGVSTGQGIDFSKDFKIVNSQRIQGEFEQSEKQ